MKTKEHNNRQNINICIRNLDTNKDRKQLNIFERKVYRRILGPVYDNERYLGSLSHQGLDIKYVGYKKYVGITMCLCCVLFTSYN